MDRTKQEIGLDGKGNFFIGNNSNPIPLDTVAWMEDELSKLLNVPVECRMGFPPDYFEFGTYPSHTIARFSMKEFHGCCGIIVSYHTVVMPAYRNKGVGKLLQVFKERLAKEAGYTIMLATTIEQNTVQNILLKKSGWRNIGEFINKRTNNRVFLWSKSLREE